jgi:hypothetical protein
VLPEKMVLDTVVPEMIEAKEVPEIRPEQLAALGLAARGEEEAVAYAPKVNTKVLNAAVEAAVNAALNSGSVSTSTLASGKKVSSEVVVAAVNAAVAAAKEEQKVSEEQSANEAVNTTEVQTLAFSTPAPVIPLPQISEPLGLGDEDYENLPGTESQNSPSSNLNSLNSNLSNSSSSNTNSNSKSSSSQNYNNTSPMQQQGGAYHNDNGVNVQTTTQPVLVVPLNVSRQSSAQMLGSPAPGAPATFAVDTSSLGAGVPSAGAKTTPSRGSSPGRTPRVSVIKTGGSSETAPATPNTRVTVVKHS